MDVLRYKSRHYYRHRHLLLFDMLIGKIYYSIKIYIHIHKIHTYVYIMCVYMSVFNRIIIMIVKINCLYTLMKYYLFLSRTTTIIILRCKMINGIMSREIFKNRFSKIYFLTVFMCGANIF